MIGANILNKQLQIADNGWSSSGGVGWAGKGLTTPHCDNPACYKMLHRALELDGLFV